MRGERGLVCAMRFITPTRQFNWGRWRYKRMAFGSPPAPKLRRCGRRTRLLAGSQSGWEASGRPQQTHDEPHAAGRLIGESRVGDPEPSRADDVNPKESVRT